MPPIAAAVGVARAIPVRPEGMSATTWAVIVLGVPMLGLIITGLLKLIPTMTKLGNEREGSIDNQRSRDLDAMRAEMAEARRDTRAAIDGIARLERCLACAVPAVTILTAEVRRLDPNSETNTALKQAHDLMAMAAGGDMGFLAALNRIPQAVADSHP